MSPERSDDEWYSLMQGDINNPTGLTAIPTPQVSLPWATNGIGAHPWAFTASHFPPVEWPPNPTFGTEVFHLDAGNFAGSSGSSPPALPHEAFLENNPFDHLVWSAALAGPAHSVTAPFANTAPLNHVQPTVTSIQQSSNTQPTRIPCEKCNKTFTRRDALKRHLNSCQANPRGNRPGIDCDLCAPGAKVFSRRDHLYQHLRGFHKVSERGIDGYKTRGGRNNAVVEEAVNDFDDNEEEEE